MIQTYIFSNGKENS